MLKTLNSDFLDWEDTGKIVLCYISNTSSIVSSWYGNMKKGSTWRRSRDVYLFRMFLKPGLHISRKDRKHMTTNMYFKLYRYGLDSKSV